MPRKVRLYSGPKGEYATYHAKPEQKENRAKRNTARRQATSAGQVHKGDGKDIDHKKPLSKGGSNSKANRQVLSASSNRSFKRNAKGGIK